jgi:hypothetical protein
MKSRISAEPAQPGAGHTPARARGTEGDSGWQLEPHCCRVCFGRIASRKVPDGREFECTNCGARGVGNKASVICACGIKIRKYKGDGRTAAVMVDAGIRCHSNKRVSPEFPALFVASYGGAQAEP